MSYTKIRRRETLYVIEVMRLQEGRDHFLKCKVELKEPDASDADLYEQFCLSLTLHNRANTPALLSAAMGSKFPLSPSITLELKPPSEGWEVSAFNVWRHKVTFSYQKRTELNISLTCSSTATPSCSAVHYPQNVQSQAEYEAQLKRRDGEAKWVKPFTALTPRISTWSFDIINADGQIQRRLLTLSASKPDAGSRLFYCTAELKPQDFKLNESVEAWCRERAEAYLAP